MIDKIKSLTTSRRFWIAIAGVAVAVSEHLGLGFEAETVNSVVLLAASWIVGDSLRATE